MRPAAIPTATRPKPQWKPAFSWSRPVNRAQEGAEVDAQVEQREARVASGVVGGRQRPDSGGARLESTRAERDQDEPDRHPGNSPHHGECDVAKHDYDGAVEQHPLAAQYPIGQPAADDCRQVDPPP